MGDSESRAAAGDLAGYAGTSMIQTGPAASGSAAPDPVTVYRVGAAAVARDHVAVYIRPSRSTVARPVPTVRATGATAPDESSGHASGVVATRWITTVAAPSCPAPVDTYGVPSIQTSHRPACADQRNS